jgi:hypothetical protein
LLRKAEVRAELIRLEGTRLRFQKGEEAEAQVAALELKWKALRRTNAGALKRLHILDTLPLQAPVYKDLFDVLTAAREIVGDLARIVGTNTNGFGAAQSVWKRRADEYWEVLVMGAKAQDRRAKLKRPQKQGGTRRNQSSRS